MNSLKVLPCLVAIGGLAACRGDNLNFDCDFQAEAFEVEVAREGRLHDTIPEGGPYPVAMMLSEAGINELLNNTVNTNVPFTGTIPFGPVLLEFKPDGEPEIELRDTLGCVDCVVFAMPFEVDLADADGSISSGAGTVRLAIPLRLETQGETDATLIAAYEEIKIEELNFSVYGFDSQEHEALGTAIQTLMEEKLRQIYGATPLMTLNSWQLGTGQVKLLAREIFVFPQEKTLALAMQTNLVLPEGAGLQKPVLDNGIKMGLAFHDTIFQAVSERMLTEGEVPRRYDEAGEPSDDGLYGVTIERLTGSDTGNRFDSLFRVWRIRDGYCGYAQAQMWLDVDHDGSQVLVRPTEVVVQDGQGAGAVAAEEEELVEDNLDVVDTFKNALADQIGLTVNYDAISLDGNSMVIDLQEVRVNPTGLFLDLDFFVVEDPG